MKRWPRVSLPLLMPSISKSHDLAVEQAEDGVQRAHPAQAVPSPQRIDFGQGKLRTISGTISATTSAVARPGFSIVAT